MKSKVCIAPCTYQVNNSFWHNSTDEEKTAWFDLKQGMLQWLYTDEDKEEDMEDRIRKDIAAQRQAIIENLDHALYGFVKAMRRGAWEKVEACALINHMCIQIHTIREMETPEYEATPLLDDCDE